MAYEDAAADDGTNAEASTTKTADSSRKESKSRINSASQKSKKVGAKTDADVLSDDGSEENSDANTADTESLSESSSSGGKRSKTIEETYQKKTQLEHILLRPDTYSKYQVSCLVCNCHVLYLSF